MGQRLYCADCSARFPKDKPAYCPIPQWTLEQYRMFVDCTKSADWEEAKISKQILTGSIGAMYCYKLAEMAEKNDKIKKYIFCKVVRKKF